MYRTALGNAWGSKRSPKAPKLTLIKRTVHVKEDDQMHTERTAIKKSWGVGDPSLKTFVQLRTPYTLPRNFIKLHKPNLKH